MLKDIAHVLAGIIVALSPTVHWTLPLIGTQLFIIYEVLEDLHLSDRAYRDILEFMIGFFGAVTGLLVLEVIVW
jgi:hypothetical protein